MTPAEELRSAAAHIREHHRPGHVRHAFWLAVAGWLDEEATDYEALDTSTQAFLAGDAGGDPDHAIVAARAYLGSEREATS